MRYENVAPPEVANHHLSDIRTKFKEHGMEVQGKYQTIWSHLRKVERESLCKVAGLKMQHVNMSIKDMDNREKRKLLKAIKNMNRVASLFIHLDLERIEGFN